MPFWRGNLANCLRYFPTQALNFAFKDKIEQNKLTDLSLSSNPWSSRLHILGSFLGSLLSLGILGGSLLGARGLGRLLCILSSSDGLLPLCFPDLGLLVPLGHDILEGGSYDSTLELGGALVTLLGGLLLKPLLVLAPVQHSPCDLPGVPLEHVGLVGAAAKELVALTISLDQGPAMAGVDFVPGVHTQVNLHR